MGSLTGLKNQDATLDGATLASLEFLRVLELLRKIQASGGVAMRIEQAQPKQQTTILAFRRKGITQATLDEVAELRTLLELSPEAQEFRLVLGATPANDRELAVVTRSSLHIMAAMSAYVDVPPEQIAESRATAGLTNAAPLRIGCSRKEPADAFVAVPYRGHWSWIDDRDLRTKRAFALLTMLFSLGDSSPRESLPLITIPAQ